MAGQCLWFVLMCFVLAVGILFGHCSLTHFSKQINVVPLIPLGPFCNWSTLEMQNLSQIHLFIYLFILIVITGRDIRPNNKSTNTYFCIPKQKLFFKISLVKLCHFSLPFRLKGSRTQAQHQILTNISQNHRFKTGETLTFRGLRWEMTAPKYLLISKVFVL